MSHRVKSVGTHAGEKHWHLSKYSNNGFHSNQTPSHPPPPVPPVLEHREPLWHMRAVVLQPERLGKPPGTRRGPKNSPSPSKDLM